MMTAPASNSDLLPNSRQRSKILISAYACRPNAGSEPGVGWNIVQQLVQYCDVWVITREDNRPSIDSFLAEHPIENLQFIYCDLPAWATWWNYQQKGVQLHYYIWQVLAYFTARKLYPEIQFDLIHHVTYVKYWSPSFLCLLPVPFIWGPVGGGESAPKAFWQDFSFRGKAYETMRDVARWLGEQDPFVRMTVRRSTLVRATTEDTAKRLRQIGATQVEIFPETGLSEQEIAHLHQYTQSDDLPIRFISMGRLLHWKGFHLGLRAFAQANLPNAEFWIVGDGPERQWLEALAADLGIAQQVKFWNRLPRSETLQKLSQCSALVHPSLHDSGGWVCLEAMAVGRPVICLDLGGPSTQITPETGFKIPAHTPNQAVAELAKAMIRLAQEPELRTSMEKAGQQRVRELYSWEVRGQSLAQLYAEIIQPK
jgi:glycosyltransferase involved in cell wall biosynthesis